MRDLRLTHGGFYRHFQGKEDLFRQALADSVRESAERMKGVAASAPGRELEAIIAFYLSEEHCANPELGCPIAALTSEIARHPKSTRSAFDRTLRSHCKGLAQLMPGSTAKAREDAAIVLLGSMSGVLNLARAAADAQLRRTVLAKAKDFYISAFCSRP